MMSSQAESPVAGRPRSQQAGLGCNCGLWEQPGESNGGHRLQASSRMSIYTFAFVLGKSYVKFVSNAIYFYVLYLSGSMDSGGN